MGEEKKDEAKPVPGVAPVFWEKPSFEISLSEYGVTVKAPNKEDCIALLEAATSVKKERKIDGAVV